MIRQDKLLNVDNSRGGFFYKNGGYLPEFVDDNQIFTIKKNGAVKHIKKSQLEGSDAYWTNKKYLVAWRFELLINGKVIDLGFLNARIDYGFIATAAMTSNVLIVVATGGVGYRDGTRLYFLNRSGSQVLGHSGALLQDVLIWFPSINHDCSRLVFIGKTEAQKIKPPPFDATLIAQGSVNPGLGQIGELARDHYTSVLPSNYGWNSVYEIVLDCTNFAATILSATEQFALHVYKVTHKKHIKTDVYGSSNGSITSVPLNNASYISAVWFDEYGVKYTETVTSAYTVNISYANTISFSGTGAPGTVHTENYNATATGSFNSKSSSILGDIEEANSIAGTANKYYHVEVTNTFIDTGGGNGYYKPVYTWSASVTESATGSGTVQVLGVNPYIQNAQIVKDTRNYTFDVLTSTPYNLPIVSYNSNYTLNHKNGNVFNVTYPSPTPPFRPELTTGGLPITAYGNSVFGFAATAARTQDGDTAYGAGIEVIPTNEECIAETFVAILAPSVFDNRYSSTMYALSDRNGNLLYRAVDWQTSTQVISGLKVFPKYAPISAEALADMENSIKSPFRILGVI